MGPQRIHAGLLGVRRVVVDTVAPDWRPGRGDSDAVALDEVVDADGFLGELAETGRREALLHGGEVRVQRVAHEGAGRADGLWGQWRPGRLAPRRSGQRLLEPAVDVLDVGKQLARLLRLI